MRRLAAFVALWCVLGVALATPARNRHELYQFKRDHACPATVKHSKASCPGWVVDHVIPLCGGGPDLAGNMQWQRLRASKAKDKREIGYCACLRAHRPVCRFKP